MTDYIWISPGYRPVPAEILRFYEHRGLKVEARGPQLGDENILLWELYDGAQTVYIVGHSFTDRESEWYYPPGVVNASALIPESVMLRMVRLKAFL